MVQVDVFWSYGIGSSFALAAFRQLRRLREENEVRRWKLGWKGPEGLPQAGEDGEGMRAIPAGRGGRGEPAFRELVRELRANGFKAGKHGPKGLAEANRLVRRWMEKYSGAFNNEYFLKNLLFLSLLFVPSGSVLLWSNPSWETMQVGRYETIPQWLVGIFTTTNITQGILGFLVTYNLLMKGKYYQAAFQTVLAYTGFFFLLANGWDNRGYRRFFSRDRESFDDWSWTNVFPWLFSDVMAILLVYGTVFLPLMFYWIVKWLMEGRELEKGGMGEVNVFERIPQAARMLGDISVGIFGGTLGMAVLATLLVRLLGWGPGMAVWAAVYGLNLSKWGMGPRLCKRIMGLESLRGVPVEETAARAVERERALVGAGAQG